MRLTFALLALLVLVVPTVQSSSHVGQVQNVRLAAGNQRLDVSWDEVTGATGYAVRVYAEGQLKTELRSQDAQETYLGARNRVAYAILVAALGPDGELGPWSDPVAATPRFGQDYAYLAAGLIVAWVGFWGYSLYLARTESGLRRQFERLQSLTDQRGVKQ